MVLLAVNGTLMRGLKLNENMLNAGATFLREGRTSPEYRLFSINDEFPGMLKVAGRPGAAVPEMSGEASGWSRGKSINLEIWDVPESGLISVLQLEPPGLCIGKVRVLKHSEDSSNEVSSEVEEVLGVLAEPWAIQGMREITEYCGWRVYHEYLENGSIRRRREEAPKPTGFIPALELDWLVKGIEVAKGPGQVRAMPYRWPFDGSLSRENTVLVIIDMQVDFLCKGGYVDSMGFDVTVTQATIDPMKNLLKAWREAGFRVIHTREGHRPDLSDCPHNKKWRSEQVGTGIGSYGDVGRVLVRGEKGWEIIPELAPLPGEPVVDKPGKGSFLATDFEFLLSGMSVKNIVICGITTDVCVHTTMREANDRGYECILPADCTAAVFPENYESALRMVTMQGGMFGTVTFSHHIIEALANLSRKP